MDCMAHSFVVMQCIILNLYTMVTLSSPCFRTGYPELVFHEWYLVGDPEEKTMMCLGKYLLHQFTIIVHHLLERTIHKADVS